MRGIVFLYKGFEEIEAVSVIDILRRSDITVELVSLEKSIVKGSHEIEVLVDKKENEVNPDDYDFLVIPGGSGYKDILNSSRVHNLIKSFHKKEKIIAAICAGPVVLQRAGILNGTKATTHPKHMSELKNASEEKVVVDKNIITSRGAGTSLDFALKIVEVLKGKSVVNELKKNLVYE